MTCHNCRIECRRFGKTRKGQQRYRCCKCFKTYSEPRNEYLGGMYTDPEVVETVIRHFVEGCSIRSIMRLTNLHPVTVLKILVLAGERCERLFEEKIQNVPVYDVQCDEIWGYVGCKEKNNKSGDPNRGDAYCFVGIERHSKLILSWHLGRRTERDTVAFTEKLNEATQGAFQITTDAFAAYFDAIHMSLGTRVDYAQVVKTYGSPVDDEHRYSPSKIISMRIKPKWGTPDPKRICTSHVERQNLTMRMQIRRLTRLTNAYSKKWENHKAALALYFAHYNFCRYHSAIRCTPAMEAKVTDHIWSISELLGATQK